MHQRPQRAIAHPVVVLGDIALAQLDEGKIEARMLGRQRKARRSFLAAIPCDPKSAMTFEQAQESGSYAAHGRLDALLAAFAHDLDGRAIGHHDQLAAVKYVADVLAVERSEKLLCARK